MELERLYGVFAKGDKSCHVDAADQMTRLLDLVHGWLTYHRGKIIVDPDHIATVMNLISSLNLYLVMRVS